MCYSEACGCRVLRSERFRIMRVSPFRTVRVREETAALADPHSESLGWSKNQFIEQCIEAIVTLIETPAEIRTLPKMVSLTDAARMSDLYPAELPPKAVARIQKMSAQEMADETTRDIGREIIAKRKKRKAKK